MAITTLNEIQDIAAEFGVALHEAGDMKWYYDNKNPASPVQPVMNNGEITDWIGYDHNAVNLSPEDSQTWDFLWNSTQFQQDGCTYNSNADLVRSITNLGKNNDVTTVAKNNNIKSGSPPKFELLIKLANAAATTLPILDSLNILINIDTANIITSIFPIPFNECPKASINSLLLFIVLAPIPYASPSITNKTATIKTNPLLKKES